MYLWPSLDIYQLLADSASYVSATFWFWGKSQTWCNFKYSAISTLLKPFYLISLTYFPHPKALISFGRTIYSFHTSWACHIYQITVHQWLNLHSNLAGFDGSILQVSKLRLTDNKWEVKISWSLPVFCPAPVSGPHCLSEGSVLACFFPTVVNSVNPWTARKSGTKEGPWGFVPLCCKARKEEKPGRQQLVEQGKGRQAD